MEKPKALIVWTSGCDLSAFCNERSRRLGFAHFFLTVRNLRVFWYRSMLLEELKISKKEKNKEPLKSSFFTMIRSREIWGAWKTLDLHQPPNFPILELQNGQKRAKEIFAPPSPPRKTPYNPVFCVLSPFWAII